MPTAANNESEPQPLPDYVAFTPSSEGRALPWLAALSSARIPYQVAQREDSWEVRVPLEYSRRAEIELGEYERVNRGWPPVIVHRPPPAMSDAALLCSLAVAAGILLVYRFTGPYDLSFPMFREGVAHSGKLLSGEWWRALTALCLHADFPHALGNAVCCGVFGVAACSQLGVGVGWCAILAGGVSGNLAAALLTGPGRISLGASTATFAALGLLAALQFVRNYRRVGDFRRIVNRSWIPLGGAAGLLALLGVSPGADLAGHLLGFLAGLAMGVALTPFERHRLPTLIQAAAGTCAVAAVAGGWFLALARG